MQPFGEMEVGTLVRSRDLEGEMYSSLPLLRRLPSVATAPQLQPRRAGRTRAAVAGRAALLRRLASAADARLVVIVAPPGYGKSTLLAEWEAHDDRRFVRMPRSDPMMGEAQPTLAEAMRSATQAIRLSGVPCVLVLDDAHLADAEALRRIVDEAMVQLPAGSALALASRREPAAPTRPDAGAPDRGRGADRRPGADVGRSRDAASGGGTGA